MARQSALKNESETQNQTPAQEKPEFSKEQLKAMGQQLKAAEQAIVADLAAITQSEYSIGLKLKGIRDGKLFRAAGFEKFDAYLTDKASEWRLPGKMTCYNYINLTAVPEKKVAQMGTTLAAKVGALAKVNPEATKKAVEKIEAALDSGKTRTEANVIFTDFANKTREKAGVNRAPGRKGEKGKVDTKSATEANEKKAEKAPEKISTADKAVVDWGKVSTDALTQSGYTKEAIVEVAGLRLRICYQSARVYVKVIASKE